MTTTKLNFIEIIKRQPDDSTPEEILKELFLSNSIEKGLQDSNSDNVISSNQMKNIINQWK